LLAHLCQNRELPSFSLFRCQGRRFLFKNYGAILPSLAQCFGVFAKPNHSAKYPPGDDSSFFYAVNLKFFKE
jgi:hypothetical protein